MNALGSKFGVFTGALCLAGLAACAASKTTLAGPLVGSASGYSLEVLVDGAVAQTFFHEGETYVMGSHGQRYTVRVHNNTGRRIEAVVSVDGLDVVDGQSAAFSKRGYLVPAWGTVDIDGWRLSAHEAAAFRFAPVGASYAASKGKARNVGVIGLAIFPERVYAPRPIYKPYGYNRPAPRPYDEYEYGSDYGTRGHGAAPADKSEAAPEARRSSGEPSGPPPASAPMAEADASGALGSSRGGMRDYRAQRRPGLGTEFGEAVNSEIREVAFERANTTNPAVVLGARYNDRQGLIAMGIDVDGTWWSESDVRRTADPFPVSHTRYAAPPRGWEGR